jgi:hypothetical protein
VRHVAYCTLLPRCNRGFGFTPIQNYRWNNSFVCFNL